MVDRSIDEQLIAVVKEHPALYDDRHEDYTNRNIREQTWQIIANTLGRNEPDGAANVKKKWDILRTLFRRECRLKRMGRRKTLWRHFQRMQFLEPFVQLRPVEEKSSDDVVDSKISTIKKENQENNFESNPEIVNVFLKEENAKSQDYQNNANMEFFTSMAITVNTFPLEHQVRIRMMLLQQVSEIQLLLEKLPLPSYPENPFKNQDEQVTETESLEEI